jgi:uncharacterized membrane protein YjgN (DUF898 family)
MENKKFAILILMPLVAIVFVVFGCIMAKYVDAFYLGLVAVLIGIFWFIWAVYESLNYNNISCPVRRI